MSTSSKKPAHLNGVNKGYQLTESQIRYAIANTTSNQEAARWLHISFACWKKYAKSYIDEATGKTLYDLHRDEGFAKRLVLPKTKYRRKSTGSWSFQPYKMEDVIANKHPNYSRKTFKNRIINEGYVPERCYKCGFQERRQYDYTVPLKLNWVDGDKNNYALENVELLCYNCYYIHVGTPDGAERKYIIDSDTGEPVPVHDPKRVSKTAPKGPYYQPKENQETIE